MALREYIQALENKAFGAPPESPINQPRTVKEDVHYLRQRLSQPNPPSAPFKGVIGNAQRLSDDAAKATGKKLWRGMVQSAAAGFGKGALLAAAVLLGVALVAATLSIPTTIPGLLSAGGLVVMGVSGVLGAITDVQARQNKLTAECAEAEQKTYEAIRQQKELERDPAVSLVRNMSFTSREMERKNTTASSQPTIGI
jgi:hypothetical protein